MILGNFAGSAGPRTDYNQTDPQKADYLIGRETIDNHIKSKENPHGLTAEQIHAAPDGYGLGTGGVFPSSVGIAGNGIARGGFFRWDSSGQSAGFPFTYGTMLVVPRDKDTSSFQLAFGHSGTYAGTIAARQYSSSTEREWDYLNPPMALGVEYRTTERHNGLPVYAKLLSLGSLPASAGVAHTNTDIAVSKNPYFIYLQAFAGDGTFTRNIENNGSMGAYLWQNGANWYVNVTAEGNASAYSGRALIKYVYQ